jgi:hypothetical protein
MCLEYRLVGSVDGLNGFFMFISLAKTWKVNIVMILRSVTIDVVWNDDRIYWTL